MTNILKMIKDAALMQKNMKKLQTQLRAKTVEFSSGNGTVTVTARGDALIAAIHIDPRALEAAQPARNAAHSAAGGQAALEKLVLTAVEGALEAAKKISADDMKGMMSDMGLPNIPGLGI